MARSATLSICALASSTRRRDCATSSSRCVRSRSRTAGSRPAIEALAKRINGINGSHVVARRVESKRRLAPEVEAGAFTVIREAANNAIKTGRAAERRDRRV